MFSKIRKSGRLFSSHAVYKESSVHDSSAAHYYVNFSFNSHFQIDQNELTSALLLIMSHLDDKVKPNMYSTSFQ